MRKTKSKKTHSVREVDAQNADSFLNGFIESNVVMGRTTDEMLSAINVVMGIYMRDDLNRYLDRVKELSLIYTVIQSVSEKFEENYDEMLVEFQDYAEREAARLDEDLH